LFDDLHRLAAALLACAARCRSEVAQREFVVGQLPEQFQDQRGAFVAEASGQIDNMDGGFAGGDCVTGPATVIRAIAAGKVAAANIDEYLGFHHEIDPGVEIPTARLNNKPPHGRIDTTEREAGERKHDFKCIECGLTDEEAYSEASRCLRCDHFGYGIFRGGRKGKW